MRDNFEIGNIFKKIIYFLAILIIILIGVIVFLIYKNNELSSMTCEKDIMEQEGLYNFIDSKGNMLTTDSEVLEQFIKEYYGKTKKSN